jgi:hypothetical protein
MLGGVAFNPDSAIPRYQSVCADRGKVQIKSRPQGINGGTNLEIGDLERLGRNLREQILGFGF